MNIAIIGDSKRIVMLCELLRRDGHAVRHFDSYSALPSFFDNDYIITDIPTHKKDGRLNLKDAPYDFTVDDIAAASNPDAHIICCNCAVKGRSFTDLCALELFESKNAVPSAEGAIFLAMQESDITLFDSRTLVVGYGRIAKIIADRMSAMKSQVTVAARSEKARLEAENSGLHSICTTGIADCIGDYDFIFQTVPHRLLGEKELYNLRGIVIEISSGGVGTDLSLAKSLSKRVIFAPGIPSKYSYITAAEIVHLAVTGIIAQR